ncbi:MAG: hypothetical protein R3E67_06535 [Pseudomonadales bacterium]
MSALCGREMDKSGAQEVLMPVVQPAELWQESKRWEQYGPELLRVKDRHATIRFVSVLLHEEVITIDFDLPKSVATSSCRPIFIKFKPNFRDEIRLCFI